MAVGQVSFHSDKKVKRVKISTRDNAIVNRLNKSKVEREVDHESERQERLRAEGRKKKAEAITRVSLGCGSGRGGEGHLTSGRGGWGGPLKAREGGVLHALWEGGD